MSQYADLRPYNKWNAVLGLCPISLQDVQNLLKSKAPKLPKAADLRFEIKISLEKALRGSGAKTVISARYCWLEACQRRPEDPRGEEGPHAASFWRDEPEPQDGERQNRPGPGASALRVIQAFVIQVDSCIAPRQMAASTGWKGMATGQASTPHRETWSSSLDTSRMHFCGSPTKKLGPCN